MKLSPTSVSFQLCLQALMHLVHPPKQEPTHFWLGVDKFISRRVGYLNEVQTIPLVLVHVVQLVTQSVYPGKDSQYVVLPSYSSFLAPMQVY